MRTIVAMAALAAGISIWGCALIVISGCGSKLMQEPAVIASKYEAEQIQCIEEADAVKGISNEEKLALSKMCRNSVKARYGRLDGGNK